MTTTRKVALAAGGTAGHVHPALVVADTYRRSAAGVEVVFFGAGRGFEQRLVSERGFPLFVLPAAPVARQSLAARARALGMLGSGVRKAAQILKAEDVKLVLGFGGYAAAAPLLAARLLGVPTAVHEANAVPGLGNRLLSRMVDRVYLGCVDAAARFPAGKSLFTGTPVRPEFFAAGKRRQPPQGRTVRLLVTGGSLGSAFLNERAPDLVRALQEQGVPLGVRHQCGLGAVDAVRRRYAASGVKADVEAYVDDFPSAFAEADFAVSCAGAGTMAELAAARLPCLLVPLSTAAEDHQAANAAAFARLTGSLWVREADWSTPGLAARVGDILRGPAQWQAATARMASASSPEAATAVVEDCEALQRGAAPQRGRRRRR